MQPEEVPTRDKTMSSDDPVGGPADVERCAVCGKDVSGGSGFARINHDGAMVNLCCPLCQSTFLEDPKPYLSRLGKAEAFQDFRGIQNPQQTDKE